MYKSRFPLFVFFLACLATMLLASCKEKNAEYPPRNWSEYSYQTSGITSRTISAILYENEHSLWLGAQGKEGLLHFDGYKWSVMNKETTGVDFDSVTAVTRDGNGMVWVGSNSGLSSFDGSSWHDISELKGLTVTSIVTEGIGDIRAGINGGSSGGVALWRNNEWSFQTLSNSNIPSGNITAMVSDYDQACWLATTDAGIIRLRDNQWESMSALIPLISQHFTCITLAPDGSVWAGSEASQLVHFNNDTYTLLNTGTSKPITAIVVTGNGNIWCATLGAGLIRYDGSKWTSFTMDNAALPTNDILTLAIGSAGNLLFSIPDGRILMIKQ